LHRVGVVLTDKTAETNKSECHIDYHQACCGTCRTTCLQPLTDSCEHPTLSPPPRAIPSKALMMGIVELAASPAI
jgi:hypothetical protein